MRADIGTRTDNSAIITFEDYNAEEVKILGATFKLDDPIDQNSSGTIHFFDYDFNIKGRDVDMKIDLYDRIMMSYEKLDQSSGESLTNSTLPSNSLAFKNSL